MARGDRGLELVPTAGAAAKGRLDERPALLDLVGVPAGAILVLEQDETAGLVESGLAAGVVQQHQGEQAEDLRLVRHQRGERPAEADRLAAEPVADVGVAGVEDQVDRRQHGVEPGGQRVVGRDPEGDSRRADLVLRPDQPLGHRRVARQKGAGDLRRGQSAEQAQGERDLCVGRERGVAAREDQRQPLVGDRGHVVVLVVVGRERGEPGELLLLGLEGPPAAEPVDRAVPRGRDDPGAGVRRDAVAGPALGRDRERLLDGVLGEVEVAERADQDRDGAPELLLECLGDRVRRYPS